MNPRFAIPLVAVAFLFLINSLDGVSSGGRAPAASPRDPRGSGSWFGAVEPRQLPPLRFEHRWSAALPNQREYGLLVDGDTVYVVLERSTLAFDRLSGRQKWMSEGAGWVIAAVDLGVQAGVLVVRGRVDAQAERDWSDKIMALDATTGERRWRVEVVLAPIPGEGVATNPAETVYVSTSWPGAVTALDAATATPRWSMRLGSMATAPTRRGDTVFAGTMEGVVWALDAATGAVRWTFETKSPIYAAPDCCDGMVYVACTNLARPFFALDAATGRAVFSSLTRDWFPRAQRPGKFDAYPSLFCSGKTLYLSVPWADYTLAVDGKTGRERCWYVKEKALPHAGERTLHLLPAEAPGRVLFAPVSRPSDFSSPTRIGAEIGGAAILEGRIYAATSGESPHLVCYEVAASPKLPAMGASGAPLALRGASILRINEAGL